MPACAGDVRGLRHTEVVEVPPETGLVGAASWAVWKLVGPAFEELAEAMRRWTAKRTENIGRVLEMAAEGAGDELERPGEVHPRVVHRLVEEGSWCDDAVAQKYLAGMLRAARTEDGQDDRAAYYMNVVTALTASQVRLHHAVYSALAEHPRSVSQDLSEAAVAQRLSIRARISAADGVVAHGEDVQTVDALGEAAFGLRREGLLGSDLSLDSTYRLNQSDAREQWFAVTPTAMGALLYMWGRGRPTARADDLGRVPLRQLDPPGPVLTDFEVGPWFPGPPETEQLVDRIQEGMVRRMRTGLH